MLDRLTWFRQAAMAYRNDSLTVYIDPWGTGSNEAPADVIFITHAHHDHFQPEEIDRLRTKATQIVAPKDVAAELSGSVTAVAPGESHHVAGVSFQTVPAYNIVEHRLERHPKANNWVGYVIELDRTTYYHSGDTDHVPELDALSADVAMVCIGGDPFTMGPSEAAGLVKVMRPHVAVPMHYGFVVGSPKQADEFRREAAPIEVQALIPTNPFEMA